MIWNILNKCTWPLTSWSLKSGGWYRQVHPQLLFSDQVVSDSSWPHGLQHTRLPCPSPSPRVCLSYLHWIGDAIQPSHPLSPSSPVFKLSQHQSVFQRVGSFPMNQLFASGGWRTGASASVLLKSIQGWFPLRLTTLIFFLSKGLSRIFSSTTVQKHQFFGTLLYCPARTTIHDYWRDHCLDYVDLCQQSGIFAF